MPHCWRHLALLLLLLATACEPREAQLLTLRSVGPLELEPGSSLHVQGENFPAGKKGKLHLAGQTHRPGQSTISVSVVVDASALDSNTATATMDAAALSALGGDGTFEGWGQLRFATHGGSGHVSGQIKDIQLLLLPEPAQAQVPDSQLRKQAHSLLQFLGLTIETESGGTQGLPIVHVEEDSLAYQAGLLPNDRIVGFNEIVVRSERDLAPSPMASTASFVIVRQETSSPMNVHISLAGLTDPILETDLTITAWLLVALCWFAALYGPFRAPSLALSALCARLRVLPLRNALRLWEDVSETVSTSDVDRAHAPRHPWRHVADMLALAFAALALLTVAMLAPDVELKLQATPMYFAIAAVAMWSSLLNAGSAKQMWWRRTATTLVQLGTLALVIALACLLSGTRSLAELVDAQGAAPHRWGLFAQPALFLAFPLFVVILGQSPARNLSNKPWLSTLGYAALLLGRLLLCGLGAVLFLGGWSNLQLHGMGEVEARYLGAALFVAKAFSLAVVLRAVRLLVESSPRSRWVLPALSVVAVSVGCAWIAVGAGQQARLFWGTVLSSASALVTASLAVRMVVRKSRKAAAGSYQARGYALSRSAASRSF